MLDVRKQKSGTEKTTAKHRSVLRVGRSSTRWGRQERVSLPLSECACAKEGSRTRIQIQGPFRSVSEARSRCLAPLGTPPSSWRAPFELPLLSSNLTSLEVWTSPSDNGLRRLSVKGVLYLEVSRESWFDGAFDDCKHNVYLTLTFTIQTIWSHSDKSGAHAETLTESRATKRGLPSVTSTM